MNETATTVEAPATVPENQLGDYLMTSIYPVHEGLAMMLTNSIAGVRVSTWLIFERHMRLENNRVYTMLVYVDEHAQLAAALGIIRGYSVAIYGYDPIGDDLPF